MACSEISHARASAGSGGVSMHSQPAAVRTAPTTTRWKPVSTNTFGAISIMVGGMALLVALSAQCSMLRRTLEDGLLGGVERGSDLHGVRLYAPALTEVGPPAAPSSAEHRKSRLKRPVQVGRQVGAAGEDKLRLLAGDARQHHDPIALGEPADQRTHVAGVAPLKYLPHDAHALPSGGLSQQALALELGKLAGRGPQIALGGLQFGAQPVDRLAHFPLADG